MSCTHYLVFAAVAVLGFIWVATTHSDELGAEEQVRIYDEAVHILGGNANVINRWHGEIRYLVVGSERFRQLALNSFNDITAATELLTREIRVPAGTADLLSLYERYMCKLKEHSVTEDSCANFVLIQSNREAMLALAKRIPLRKVYQQSLTAELPLYCFFAPFVSARQVIEQTFIYVDSDLDAAMLETCLSEEIYQSFGMFNDFSGAHYFSFNNIVEPKQITQYDRLLLRTLYDPDFAPGTPVFTVMKRFMNELTLSEH